MPEEGRCARNRSNQPISTHAARPTSNRRSADGVALLLRSRTNVVADSGGRSRWNTLGVPMKRPAKSAIELYEEAVYLLRSAPASALAAYYTGSLPFVLAFLFFWADMSQRCCRVLRISRWP